MSPESAFFFGMYCGAALLALLTCGVLAYFGRERAEDRDR